MARAIRIEGTGGTEVLCIRDMETPVPGAHEILVEVAAAGLNRADILQRRGFYPAPAGTVEDIPGLEFAGTVCALGPGADRWTIGQRVMGICAGGAMATHLAVHQDTAIEVPGNLDLEQAAALPEVFFTAFDALQQAGLRQGAQGTTVLIHAIGSGVGVAALQLVHRAGAVAVGTSRTEHKLAKARALGLQETILVEDGRFAKALKGMHPGGADVILDFVGAAYLAENVKSLATCGTLVVIGLLGGVTGELPLGLLLAKRARVIGTVLRSRPLADKIALSEAFAASVLPGIADGSLVPVVDSTFPMEEIAAAHDYMESNQSFGKIVMRW